LVRQAEHSEAAGPAIHFNKKNLKKICLQAKGFGIETRHPVSSTDALCIFADMSLVTTLCSSTAAAVLVTNSFT
jgi:hypothetical protein